MSYFESLNAFVVSHQIVMTLVLMPLVSGVVAFFSSRFSTKRALRSAINQRRYEATSVLSRFRQSWINELRNDVAEHQAICLASQLHLNEDGVEKSKMYRLAELSNRILLRMNPSDPDYSAFATALAAERARITDQTIAKVATMDIAQRILKREWERLKDDLHKDAVTR